MMTRIYSKVIVVEYILMYNKEKCNLKGENKFDLIALC